MDLPQHYARSLKLVGSRTKWFAILACISLSLVTLLDLVGVGLIYPIAKFLSGDQKFMARDEVQLLTDFLGTDNGLEIAVFLSFGFLVLLLVKGTVSAGVIYWSTKYIVMAEARFVGRLYRSYLRAPIEYHHQHNSAEFIRNLNQSVVFLFRTTLMTTLQAVSGIVMSIGIVGIMVYTDPIAAVTCLFILGAGGVIYSQVVTSKVQRMARSMHHLNAVNLKTTQESLGGIADIKVLDKYRHFLSAYMKARNELTEISYIYHLINLLPKYIMESLVGILLASVIFILVSLGRSGEDVVAILALYAVASMRLLPVILALVKMANSVRSAIPSIEQLSKDVDYFGNEIIDDRHWYELEGSTPGAQQERVSQSIEFQNITYAYPSGETALQDVSISIKSGTSLGVVGRSGAGKTTLANILLGLIEPTSGSILIDGQVSDMKVPAIRRSIGYVPQHIYLLDDSIAKNVAFGCDDEEIDEDAVWQALTRAQLADFVRNLPEQLTASIGERGVRLSGGQRQRVGIARALYNNPDILVLDEATSALDVETELNISNVIEGLKGEKTLFIIAHRISTIRNCDNIVFMADGKVKETGNFDALEAQSGEFKKMIAYSYISES